MHFLKTTLALALALVSATSATAAPMPKADKDRKVSIDEMTMYACVVRLYSAPYAPSPHTNRHRKDVSGQTSMHTLSREQDTARVVHHRRIRGQSVTEQESHTVLRRAVSEGGLE